MVLEIYIRDHLFLHRNYSLGKRIFTQEFNYFNVISEFQFPKYCDFLKLF